MKKQFTLLAGILLVGGSAFAQTPTTAQSRLQKIALNTQKYPVGGSSSEKAEGDSLWGSNFSNPAQWTMTTAGQGTWVIGTTASQPDLGVGATVGSNTNGLQTGFGYGASGQFFTPPTKSNGFAGFNGIKFLLSPPVTAQNASLTSESIDFTGKNVVTVTFYQWYRAFNRDNVYLEYSPDGTDWTASFPLNGGVQTNTYTTGNLSVDINTMGSATGRIRFRWESPEADNQFGSGYGWALDDVKITDGAASKANILFRFQSVGTEMIEFTKFPKIQVTGGEAINFWTHIQNSGNSPITTTLNVTTASGYNQTSAPSTSASLQKDTLTIPAANGFFIPATEGVYNFTYKVGATTDLSNTSDTTRIVPFEVTNTVMAVDSYDGTPASITGSFGNWSEQEVGDYTGVGNFFPTFKTGKITGVQVGFDVVSAEDSAYYVGLPYTVTLLKYNATTEAYVSVAQTDGLMTPGSFGNLTTVNFAVPYTVAAADGYVVMVSSQIGEDQGTSMGGVPIGFSGTNIKGNTLGTTSQFAEVNVNLAANALTPDLVDAPVIRLVFEGFLSTEENVLSAADVVVAPNPFSNETAIRFDLNSASSVSAVVTDLSGRTVMTVPASTMNAGKQSLNIDGTSFNAGVYNVAVTINGNTVVKRIVKK